MTLIYVWIIKTNFILIKVWIFHFISIIKFILCVTWVACYKLDMNNEKMIKNI